MTCKMRLKEGSVRIGVPRHILIYLAQPFEAKIRGGGEGQKYTFWKSLSTGSPQIPKSQPNELQKKSVCGRSLKVDVPQAEMLLSLLHFWKELLQI